MGAEGCGTLHPSPTAPARPSFLACVMNAGLMRSLTLLHILDAHNPWALASVIPCLIYPLPDTSQKPAPTLLDGEAGTCSQREFIAAPTTFRYFTSFERSADFYFI